ncbi:MAG TPA: hypothetical protein QGG18_08870, partial [Rhodospirillales bacterium]|nr:hypothetical protein [Rhodospirillales bacterium]
SAVGGRGRTLTFQQLCLSNGPYNFAILRHMALNLIKKEETKGSNRVKFKRAGWNDDFLIKLLAQN